MKSSRIGWSIVSLVVLVTIAITFGTPDSHSQQKPQPTPIQQATSQVEDISKYAIAIYDASEPENAKERDERRLKNKRYDNQAWVIKNPLPRTTE